MNIDVKTLNKILAHQAQQHRRRILYHDQVGSFPEMQGWFNTRKSKDIIQQRRKIKHNNYLVISGEKAFNKV